MPPSAKLIDLEPCCFCRIVFAGTNALVAMLCFRPSEGNKTLALEVAEAEESGECTLLICDVVAAELREVVDRDFPNVLPSLEPFLQSYGVVELPEAGEVLLERVRAVCVDPDDAPISAAVQTERMSRAFVGSALV